MIRETPFDPQPSGDVLTSRPPDSGRIDDEYVFSFTGHPDPDGTTRQLSVRVDPDDGSSDELVLRVTERVVSDVNSDPPQRETVTVTIPAPALGSPPRTDDFESVLETWCRRHWCPDARDGQRLTEFEP
jgi:hypothetical protein